MEPAYLSAFAALAGSVIGGLTSLTASWVTQRVQANAQQRAHDVGVREDLYRVFIDEASKSYADALERTGQRLVIRCVAEPTDQPGAGENLLVLINDQIVAAN